MLWLGPSNSDVVVGLFSQSHNRGGGEEQEQIYYVRSRCTQGLAVQGYTAKRNVIIVRSILQLIQTTGIQIGQEIA